MCAMSATAAAPRAAAGRSAQSADTPRSSNSRKAKGYLEMLKQTGSDWMEDKAMKLAASLAFYTMLSIAPLIIIAIKIVSRVFSEQFVTGQLQSTVKQFMGEKAAQVLLPIFAEASRP